MFLVEKMVTKNTKKLGIPDPNPPIEEIFLNFTNVFSASVN